ncbi:MAG: hypothetical protein IJQ20_06590 [Paludibacteraceae bacterium]|nr:hypothetical protein [Paludibacteraceae bacterium]
MTDICYIIGTGSRWDDNELRFSLRSIAKYGQHVGRIILVGHCPAWINREAVTVIDAADETGCKHTNIALKIRKAIETLHLKDDFLISSDDHIYVQPTDFDSYPVFARSRISPVCRDIYNEYHRSMVETRKYLISRGLTYYRTNPHFNTWIVPKLFDEILEDVLKQDTMDGIEINCVMGNTLIAKGRKYVMQNDMKVMEPKTPAQWQHLSRENHCLSLDDRCITIELAKWLLYRFPDPSPYETDAPNLIDLVNPKGRRAIHFRRTRDLVRR